MPVRRMRSIIPEPLKVAATSPGERGDSAGAGAVVPAPWAGAGEPGTLENLDARAEAITPVLLEALSRPPGVEHWGINE